MVEWKVIVVVRESVVMSGYDGANETRGLGSLVERGGQERQGRMNGGLVGNASAQNEQQQ